MSRRVMHRGCDGCKCSRRGSNSRILLGTLVQASFLYSFSWTLIVLATQHTVRRNVGKLSWSEKGHLPVLLLRFAARAAKMLHVLKDLLHERAM